MFIQFGSISHDTASSRLGAVVSEKPKSVTKPKSLLKPSVKSIKKTVEPPPVLGEGPMK